MNEKYIKQLEDISSKSISKKYIKSLKKEIENGLSTDQGNARIKGAINFCILSSTPKVIKEESFKGEEIED